MTSARQRRSAMHARNAGLQRLRTFTKRVGIVTVVLTGLFAGLAAAGNSGHHRRRTVSGTGTTTTTSNGVPAPPSLPPLQGDNGSQAPSQPQPPVQTSQPPVTSSGGS